MTLSVTPSVAGRTIVRVAKSLRNASELADIYPRCPDDSERCAKTVRWSFESAVWIGEFGDGLGGHLLRPPG